jgi:enterochelin esterase-like enzyme
MARWQSFDAFIQDALNTPIESRQNLVDALLIDHENFPWVNGDKATFIYARPGATRVAVNMDTIRQDPPFVAMESLAGTTLWYVTVRFEPDDLLDYMIAIDDPMTPLAGDANIVERVRQYWHADPYNQTRLETPQMSVSVLRMADARPFPDWSKMRRVAKGSVSETSVRSVQLNFSGRRCWVYTPPGYEENFDELPLLILLDGEWANGPLQAPFVADALTKHQRTSPMIIAMMQSADQASRDRTFLTNDRHYQFLTQELLPYLQTEFRVHPDKIGLGGFGMGAVAAAHSALKNPAVFSRLMMLSAPLGEGKGAEELRALVGRFDSADRLPERIYHSVGRYEGAARFKIPARDLRDMLNRRGDSRYRFSEIGSGHSLVAFRSVLPEAFAWLYPPEAVDD